MRSWNQTLLISIAVAAAFAGAPTVRADARTWHLRDDGGARSEDRLRFELESTKGGVIHSTVEGHVREFDLSYDREGEAVRDVRVRFSVDAMDTENGRRDEKMKGFCLDAERFPAIEVVVPGPVPANARGELPARIMVRGRSYPIRIRVAARPSGQETVIEGRAAVSLSALGVPDPSIWIARVRDRVDITFRLTVPNEPSPS